MTFPPIKLKNLNKMTCQELLLPQPWTPLCYQQDIWNTEMVHPLLRSNDANLTIYVEVCLWVTSKTDKLILSQPLYVSIPSITKAIHLCYSLYQTCIWQVYLTIFSSHTLKLLKTHYKIQLHLSLQWMRRKLLSIQIIIIIMQNNPVKPYHKHIKVQF